MLAVLQKTVEHSCPQFEKLISRHARHKYSRSRVFSDICTSDRLTIYKSVEQ